jgi:CBS domain-containing protein
MQVKEIMKKNVKIIKPDSTLKEASEYMRDMDCGYLPVGENDKLTGAITDRDIIVRGIAAGHDSNDAMVKDVMTGKVQYCFEDDDIKVAGERMKNEKVRRLVVLNKDKRMTGVISLGDIACHCNDNHMTGEIMKCCAKAA